MTDTHERDWLVISVSTAGAAGTLRVQVWRKLRSLGALYLQQSVCLLPARAEVVREVRRLADRIHHQGGTARILRMSFADPADEHTVVEGSTPPATPNTPKSWNGCPRCAKNWPRKPPAADSPTPRSKSPKPT